jgi:hypothetical protein
VILATTVVALPLAALAIAARRAHSNLEEIAWRLVAIAMVAMPAAWLMPKVDVGFHIPVFTSVETPLRVMYDDGAPEFAILIYTVVSTILLLRLAMATVIAERVRTGRRAVRVPVTVGLLVPTVVLPPTATEWTAEKTAAILAHERAHVRRRDPLWRFIAQLGTAICWFHPLAWLAARSIEHNAEVAADREAALAAGDRFAYAELLLHIVAGSSPAGRMMIASAMNDSVIARRIEAILRSDRPIRRVSPFVTIALTLLLATSTLASMTKEIIVPAGMHQMTNEEFFAMRDEYRTRFREKLRQFFRSFR